MRLLLVIFFMPPLHRSQFDGKPSPSALAGRPQMPPSMVLKLRDAYTNQTRFKMTLDAILPHPHSMSLAVTIFEGPPEIRQDLKVTTPFPVRNSKKTCRYGSFRILGVRLASARACKTLTQWVIHKTVTFESRPRIGAIRPANK